MQKIRADDGEDGGGEADDQAEHCQASDEVETGDGDVGGKGFAWGDVQEADGVDDALGLGEVGAGGLAVKLDGLDFVKRADVAGLLGELESLCDLGAELLGDLIEWNGWDHCLALGTLDGKLAGGWRWEGSGAVGTDWDVGHGGSSGI